MSGHRHLCLLFLLLLLLLQDQVLVNGLDTAGAVLRVARSMRHELVAARQLPIPVTVHFIFVVALYHLVQSKANLLKNHLVRGLLKL